MSRTASKIVRWIARNSWGIAIALLVAAASTAQETPPTPPPKWDGPGLITTSGQDEPNDAVAAARVRDDAAYANYLHERELLLMLGCAGQWLAIAGGEILPQVKTRPAPVATLDELLKIVDAAHPDALHRYVFRVGEEETVAYHFFAPNLPFSDACGTGLFRATMSDHDVVYAPHRVYASNHGKKHSWAYGEKGIDLALADPTGASSLSAIVTPSSACDGTLVLSSETAAKLKLELFEIPGTCLYGPEEMPADQRYRCHRARVRWRVPELDVDALVPVAIWPARPAH